MAEEQYKNLKSIDRHTINWKTRVVILVKKPMRQAANNKKTKYQKLILADEWGNCVDVVIYNSNIELYEEIIHQDMAYVMSNVGIENANNTYKSVFANTRYSWTINANTVVMSVDYPPTIANPFKGSFSSYDAFKIGPSINVLLIIEARLIIWDEATMAHRKLIEALNNLLRDLTRKAKLFGGKTVVFGGDFRQTIPVVRRGGRMETVNACLVRSVIWPMLRKLRLTKNMRAREDPQFMEYLMRIGDGKEPTERGHKVNLPENMCINYKDYDKPLEHLILEIYPSFEEFSSNPYSDMERAIFTPMNNCVDQINDSLIDMFPRQIFKFYSTDLTKDTTQQTHYQDFLNATDVSGLPQYVLRLKVNCPIMMLRNLNAMEGLCNGTRMIVKELGKQIIGVTIASGEHRGKYVMIPRISLEPKDNLKCLVHFTRKQFSISLCFAMTINKAQGQTLEKVGIYLPQPVFSHGQLYVALSRARRSSAIKVLIRPPTVDYDDHTKTRNVVYTEILQNQISD